MTATPPAKFVRHEVREIEGRLVVVFIAQNADGSEVSSCFPAEGLQAVFADAARRVRAFLAQRGRQPGEWQSTIAQAATWNIGTLSSKEGERVLVTTDQGLATELNFYLSSQDATELGRQLIEEAQRISPERSQSH